MKLKIRNNAITYNNAPTYIGFMRMGLTSPYAIHSRPGQHNSGDRTDVTQAHLGEVTWTVVELTETSMIL